MPPASPSPKACPCSGGVAALNGEGDPCWGVGGRARVPSCLPWAWLGRGHSPLPGGRTCRSKPQTQGVLQQGDPRGAGPRPRGGHGGTQVTRGDAGGIGGARVAPGVAAARAVPCNTATVSLEGPTGRPHAGWGHGHGHGGDGGEPTLGTPVGLRPPPRTPAPARRHPTPPHPPLQPPKRCLTSPCGETEARPPATPHSARTAGWRGAGGPFPTYPDVTVVPLPSLMIICWQSCSVRRSPSLSSVRAASASIPTRWPGPARKLGGR